MKFTKAVVESLALPEPPKGQKFYWADEPLGFGVRVGASGVRSYIVQRMIAGKVVRFTIGKHGALTLEQARDRARKRVVEMVDGINPHDARRAAKAQTETLAELAAHYCANKRTRHGPLRPASIDNINGYMNSTFKDWQSRQVGSITRAEVVALYQKKSATAPANTNQAFRILKALFNWYMSKHQADDGTCASMPANPVAVAFRQGGQVRFAPERVRETRIPRDRIGAVWSALQQYADPQFNQRATCVGADLVQFLILSGCRVGEACQLRWENVRLDDPLPTYHLPATLTKTHLPLTHPASSAMRAVLERRLAQRSRGEEYVFPAVRGKKPYFQDPHKLFKKLTLIAGCPLHPHAMRRTTESILQALDIDGDTRRAILNHAPIDVHAKHYSNSEPATLLPVMEAVSEYVLQQAETAKADMPRP